MRPKSAQTHVRPRGREKKCEKINKKVKQKVADTRRQMNEMLSSLTFSKVETFKLVLMGV